MKAIVFFLPVFVILVSLSVACSRDDNDDSEQTLSYIKVTIDGVAWQGTVSNIATSGGIRQVNAMHGNGSSVQIFFPADTTGIFDFATDPSFTASYNNGSVFWSNNISGTIILSANSTNHVSGTFSTVTTSAFTTDTITMTNGEFIWKP